MPLSIRSFGALLPVPTPHSPLAAHVTVIVAVATLLLFKGLASVPDPPVTLFQYAWGQKPVMSSGSIAVGAPLAPLPSQLTAMLSVVEGVKMLRVTSSLVCTPCGLCTTALNNAPSSASVAGAVVYAGLVAPGMATPLRYHCTLHGPESPTRNVAFDPSNTGVSTGCRTIRSVAGLVLMTPGVTPRNSTSEICMQQELPLTVGKMSL